MEIFIELYYYKDYVLQSQKEDYDKIDKSNLHLKILNVNLKYLF
jgi:hypothetical protein